ncbi:MAG: hypothetical protein FWC91_04735 [Defluviitaleaceae bacterium]|nr:hypothetical protein [Defluviitaleaceae bacterium]
MELRHKEEMINLLDTYIEARIFDNRAIFLFGHCNATEEMADYLLTHEIIPTAIFDNNISKQKTNYREIPIIAPESIQNYHGNVHSQHSLNMHLHNDSLLRKNNSIVLIATRFFSEMKAQLRRLGYDGEIIQVVEYNSFTEYSLSGKTLLDKKERVLRGTQILEQIRIKYPVHHIVVLPHDALGDIYWAMSYMQAYCDKHLINDVCIVIVGKRCRQVIELFGEHSIIVLDHKAMNELVQAIIFTCEENCIIAHHDYLYTDLIIQYLNKHFLSFIDYYRYAVYGLNKDARATEPTNFAPFDNKVQIPKGKSVIVSPYAKSVVELPSGFWENIVETYVHQGYHVYTNVAGNEPPIYGTKQLYVPLAQMKAAVEYAGAFIGIRSGLCDVICTANCRKIVVFPDCYYSTTPYKVDEFFALPGWEKIITSE